MSFEDEVRRALGRRKWESLSEDDRQVVREMSRCQETGRPVGSLAWVKEYEKETRK